MFKASLVEYDMNVFFPLVADQTLYGEIKSNIKKVTFSYLCNRNRLTIFFKPSEQENLQILTMTSLNIKSPSTFPLSSRLQSIIAIIKRRKSRERFSDVAILRSKCFLYSANYEGKQGRLVDLYLTWLGNRVI